MDSEREKTQKFLQRLIKLTLESQRELNQVQSGQVRKRLAVQIILEGVDAIFYEEMLAITKEMMPDINQKTLIRAFNRRMAITGLSHISQFLIDTFQGLEYTIKDIIKNGHKDNPFNFR